MERSSNLFDYRIDYPLFELILREPETPVNPEHPDVHAMSAARNPAKSPAPAGAAAADPLYVTALARGLSVLRCLGDAQSDLTVSEIARRLELPQSTVWRSCHTMLQHGYLVRVEQDRLRPGLALLGLGHAALSRQPLAELARPGMEDIARRFSGAVSLGQRDGFEMLYLQRVEGGAVIYPGLRTGSRVSVLSSAMGWAYIAALPEGERKEFLAGARAQMKEQYQRIAGQLADSVKYYAEHGLIVNSGIIHPELNAVAIPIGPHPRTPIGSISFGGRQPEFPTRRLLKEVAPLLRELAQGLSRSLADRAG